MKEKEPLVSVIVPVYNVESYLKRCIESILNQTYDNFEIILVDDGSTDKSVNICDDYHKNPFIKVIHKKNGGLSSARNCGLDHNNGDYITFIDADDFVAPNYLETLVSLIINHNAEISIVGMTTTKNSKIKPLTNSSSISINPETALKRMLLEHGFSVSATGKLYIKQLFEHNRYPEGKLYEDNGCTYKLFMKSHKIAFADIPLYYYFIRQDSITNSSFNIQKTDYITLTDEACKTIYSKYPNLKNACLNRMAVARLSILRQILNSPQNTYTQQLTAELINFFRTHSRQILHSKDISPKIRISTMLILLNPKLIKIIGNIYEKIK